MEVSYTVLWVYIAIDFVMPSYGQTSVLSASKVLVLVVTGTRFLAFDFLTLTHRLRHTDSDLKRTL